MRTIESCDSQMRLCKHAANGRAKLVEMYTESSQAGVSGRRSPRRSIDFLQSEANASATALPTAPERATK